MSRVSSAISDISTAKDIQVASQVENFSKKLTMKFSTCTLLIMSFFFLQLLVRASSHVSIDMEQLVEEIKRQNEDKRRQDEENQKKQEQEQDRDITTSSYYNRFP